MKYFFRRSPRRLRTSRRPATRLGMESLESRQMMSATPASASDLYGPAVAESVVVPQAVEGGPTLAPVEDQMTAAGDAITFVLEPTIPVGDDFELVVVAAGSFTAPANVAVSINKATREVTLTPAAGFKGSIELRAGVRSDSAPDEEASYDFEAFTLDVVTPTLNAFQDPTTTIGMPVMFTLTSNDPLGHGVVYSIVDPTTLAAPANVTVNITATGQVTLTPNAGFTGTIQLLARVRSIDSPDVAGNYATEAFTLQVASSLSLAPINNVEVPGDKSVLVPLTGVDSTGQPITYTYSSSNSNVQLSLVSQASKSIVLNVSGTDGDGNPFSGTITLKLFEDLSPETTARIKQLVSSGFYNGKSFHRVIDGFMAQAADNSGQTIKDEFTDGLAFTSRGLLAMANGGPDTGDSQFFITAVQAANSTNPIALSAMPQHLNYKHTIFGQMVSGFDVFDKLMSTDVTTNPNNPNEQSRPVNTITITSAQLIDDVQNAVLKISSPSGFTGDATITVTATGAGNQTTQRTFTATGVTDSVTTDRPFLGAVSNQTTTKDNAAIFTLTSTSPSGAAVAYRIVAAGTSFTAPVNLSININQATGQVTITPGAGVTGTFNLRAAVRLASASDTEASYDTQAFTLTVTDSATTLTLNAVGNQTTTKDTQVVFTLTSANPNSDAITYKVADASTFGQPANVTVVVNQNTGQVTLTPATGFVGTINLIAGVRKTSDPDVQASYSTRTFTLTVTATGVPAAPTGLALLNGTAGGAFDDAGYIASGTPTLTVTAATGSTVKIKRGTTEIGTATETAAGSGIFRLTLPAGTLAVGANSLTAVASNTAGTGADSTALALNYAPNYDGGVYVVPGTLGAAQSLTFAWTSKNAAYNNEFGYVVVDAADGTIDGLSPDDAAYARTLMASTERGVIFSRGQSAGATINISLAGGKFVVFYMIQNNTTANFLAKNPSNTPRGNNNGNAPLAFFSVEDANPDGQKHAQIVADPMTGFAQYNWEDLYTLGDSDFNDAAFTVRLASQTTSKPGGVRSPGSTGDSTLSGTLQPKSQTSLLGDVGVFLVDGPNGNIGSLTPGSAGYAAAALAASNVRVLYSAGETGVQTVAVPAGKYVGFYMITSGTTANWLTANSTNSATGSTVALFSFDDANPDDANHFRWVSPGSEQADPTFAQLHVMSKVNGNDGDFDAFVIDLKFTA